MDRASAGISERAVAAALGVAASHGVRCEEPRVLADGYSVVVHLAPAPVVARVPTVYRAVRPGIGWRARELEVATFLHRRGAAVVPPSDELPPGPHEADGFVITFWRYVPARAGAVVTERDLAPALADLHRHLAAYPEPLPVLAGPAHDVPHCLDLLERAPGPLDPGQVGRLRDVHTSLLPLLRSPPGVLQPVHGDVFPGNAIPTDDGLLWCDFEDVCLAPVAWDVANLRPDPADRTALEAYPDPPSDEELAPFEELRALHVAVFIAAAPLVDGFSPTDRDAFLADLLARWTR